MKHLWLGVWALLLAGACTNDEYLIETVPAETSEVRTTRSMEEVWQIANNATQLLENAQTRSVVRTIDPAATQYVTAPSTRSAGENDTLLYIVNYADEQGFAVVSANRYAEGLLAVVEQGSYGVDGEFHTDNPGFTAFMEQARNYSTRSIPPGGPIIGTDPDVIWETKDVVDTTYKNKIEPMVAVRWGQTGIEGKYCPNGIAGCSNVAMAQIMSYFHYPYNISITYPGASVSSQYLNWTAMENHKVAHGYQDCTATNAAHESISQLIRQLGELNKSDYLEIGGTSTAANNVRNSFANMGYNVSTLDSYTDQSLERALALGKLMYMRGDDKDDNGGHGWVVDGAYKYTTRTELWVRPINQINWQYHSLIGTKTVEYLHYNWGWDGNCNGFFVSKVFAPNRGAEYDDESYSNSISYNFVNNVMYFTVSR